MTADELGEEVVVRAVAFVADRNGCSLDIAMELLCELSDDGPHDLVETALGIVRDMGRIDEVLDETRQNG